MLSEERIMEIAECCPVWYAIPQGREKALLTKFARAIEREVAKGRPRCAELSESINNRAREQAQKTVNNGVYLDKLATLEAELSGLRARYLRMKSEDAATIAQLRDENARLTQYKDGAYTALQKKNDELDALQSTIAQQAEQLAAAQARIDALMLEYCPKDMTPEQLANYAAHQRPATPEEQAAIDAAIAAQKVNHAQP